jgi:hypothetical protein
MTGRQKGNGGPEKGRAPVSIACRAVPVSQQVPLLAAAASTRRKIKKEPTPQPTPKEGPSARASPPGVAPGQEGSLSQRGLAVADGVRWHQFQQEGRAKGRKRGRNEEKGHPTHSTTNVVGGRVFGGIEPTAPTPHAGPTTLPRHFELRSPVPPCSTHPTQNPEVAGETDRLTLGGGQRGARVATAGRELFFGARPA